MEDAGFRAEDWSRGLGFSRKGLDFSGTLLDSCWCGPDLLCQEGPSSLGALLILRTGFHHRRPQRALHMELLSWLRRNGASENGLHARNTLGA